MKLQSFQASSDCSLFGDASDGAVRIAKALTSFGYRADLTIESLGKVDRFFDEQVTDGQARASGLLAKNLSRTLFCLGAYCGDEKKSETTTVLDRGSLIK